MSQRMGSFVRQEPAWPGWRISTGQSWGEDGGDNQEEVSLCSGSGVQPRGPCGVYDSDSTNKVLDVTHIGAHRKLSLGLLRTVVPSLHAPLRIGGRAYA